MSVVLERSELEGSPLSDLHVIANEVGVDGFRRMRKAELVDAILSKQGGEKASSSSSSSPSRSRTRSTKKVDADKAETSPAATSSTSTSPSEEKEGGRGTTRSRSRRSPRSRASSSETRSPDSDRKGRDSDRGDKVVEGVVELLTNGSGFLRLNPDEPSEDDVYISAAQVKRCELTSGDRVSGPTRPPRRSERFAALVRVEMINGKKADEVVDTVRFEDLPATFPTERFTLASEDTTVKTIEWLTPFGKGSRVTIVGPSRAGKSEALRKIAVALGKHTDLQMNVVLAGVRPEEVSEWAAAEGVSVSHSVLLGSSAESQQQAVDQGIEQGRRIAARGGDAVVLVDSIEALSISTARRLLSAARKVPNAGSLTIVATAPAVIGGETTVIALDATLTGIQRFPALDLDNSGTIRPELLVGEAGADAIAKARAEALV